MHGNTATRRSTRMLPARDSGRARAPRRRWFRVKVETEGGAYVGSLRLGSSPGGLRALVEDERSYLGLWSATHESSDAVEDFVALHKGSIRVVVLLGADGQRGAAGEGE